MRIYIALFLWSLSPLFGQKYDIDCAILEDSCFIIQDNLGDNILFSSYWISNKINAGNFGVDRNNEFIDYNDCLKKYVTYTSKKNIKGIYLQNAEIMDMVLCKNNIYLSMKYEKYSTDNRCSIDSEHNKFYIIARMNYSEANIYKNKLDFVQILDTSTIHVLPLNLYKHKKKIIDQQGLKNLINKKYPQIDTSESSISSQFSLTQYPSKIFKNHSESWYLIYLHIYLVCKTGKQESFYYNYITGEIWSEADFSAEKKRRTNGL